ncbi:hypothetical protein [Paraclostridium bifermentans]|uniref:hypothetical protein n=1 Tax=Paraclostridium bifermentans TaxID=1490 RepID=UPI0024B8E435|nr:hypothetical protein [Paraclostridium bifermentans]
MKLEDYIKIITCISSIIAVLSTYSKFGENTRLSEEYFEKVLRIYIREYKRNKYLDPIKFIKRRFNIGDYFIPSYVFHLIDVGRKEQLHKVLIVDYREGFPNKRNRIELGISSISILLAGIMIFIYYFVLAAILVLMIITVICIVGNFVLAKTMDMNDVNNIKIMLLAIIISIILVVVLFNNMAKSDNYSLKIEHIEKLIKKKENKFNKASNLKKNQLKKRKGYYIV